MDHIQHVLEQGHMHFGENKVQEATEKWTSIRHENKNIRLHLIGGLQTNKVRNAIQLFDYIHSLDSKKLADKISYQVKEQNVKTKIFIQVNLGKEKQKSGIDPDQLDSFYNYCINEKNLNIIGLMTIPPNDGNAEKYFIDKIPSKEKTVKKCKKKIN